MRLWIALMVVGCGSGAGGQPRALDLTEVLGAGEVRAGVVRQEAALIGGLAAEGRVGDLKIYNDRVQFIVQGLRQGDYYVQQGGGVVDADIVRPAGQPGRDVVDEWGAMIGFGRMVEPERIEVLSDGRDGQPAVVRVHGSDTALALLEGAVELPGFISDLGVTVVQDFVLRPDSWLMEVHTTVTAADREAAYQPGDVLFSGPEAADSWAEGVGMGSLDPLPRRWATYVGRANDVAVGVFASPGTEHTAAGADLITELAFLVLGFGERVELEPGESHTWTRWYGVGPDLATLTDAALEGRGDATEPLSGLVSAADGPVAGARVAISVDGEPFTLAVSDAQGRFEAQVPSGAQATAQAIGRSDGIWYDLPEGAAPYGPYSPPTAAATTLTALREGAEPVAFARGRGIGSAADPLTLGVPGRLVVSVPDGLPFSVRVGFTGADPVGLVAESLVHGRPDGLAAAGFSADGSIAMEVEPGSYEVLVHRGLRWELASQQVDVVAGQTSELSVDLGPPIAHSGWLLGDPHTHASPSGDGEITMEGRLLVSAGGGVQLHFGTDHDHVADYNPLIEALGLESVLATVVADEVSPVLRGHLNVYPIAVDPKRANGGAVPWWTAQHATTQALFDDLRARHGAEFIIQSNHPLDSGLAESADWEPGAIRSGARWSADFQAIEVNNSGSLEGLPPYFDFVTRGMSVAAVGVTDSHGPFGGDPGINGTWLPLGDDPGAVTDSALIGAIRGQATIATRGPFLELSVQPGSTVQGAVMVDAQARSPSWIGVDRLLLFRDGVEVSRVDGTQASFDLSWAADCVYNVVAEGDGPMLPLSGRTPWAMSGAIRYDATGDGWTAPLPPLQVDP